ncbi:amino acid adenylation domain-containing protein [Pseudomonas chlororaphis]|uniref:Carrier domain-containing protein n=1 Tax=Pseudomonas chlororaphis TaxID=587753 RepID=A0A1Q8EPK7_9PSED|nr:amino acid adenylation domain-containing protein [Pseudomonas chlororaphis]OLF53730.1 hypothetical protein BTN82_15805 [Pseudomonas chlororaphis]
MDTILELIERKVIEHPGQLAVVDAARSLSYAQLDAHSSRVAACLQARNIGRGDCVLVQAQRSIELVVALLAVIKSGAAFVPVDRRLPQNRKEYIARQCNASFVLSTHEYDTLPLLSCEVHTVDALLRSPEPLTLQPVGAQPEDVMYVIFTSGTTGAPKGVMIEHHSVAELMLQHNANLDVTSSSRATLMASVGFDLCQSEIWSTLIAGACLYLLDDESLLNSDEFLKFCATNRITHGFVPTLKVYDLLNARQPEGLCLKCLYTAGEKLHPVEVEHLPYRLVDCYGPTEATIYVTSKTVESKRLNRPASIGWPIANCKVYILDEALAERAAGEVGELCIAGSCLARGYLGAPELTAERFIHSDVLGCRLYRSGDRARLLADGSLQFLGRIDGQVKIRGYRVETGEIESRLLKETPVSSVAVVVQDSGTQAEKCLVAFVVPRDKQAHSGRLIAGLRRSLEADLPDYMLPEKYYCLDVLPSNANGKTDKQALLEYLKDVPPASLDVERFADESQRALAGVWFRLLGHGDFAPNDRFLEVGGHSLRIAELAKALSEHFKIKVSVRDIYEHLVFKDLAAELHRRTHHPAPNVATNCAGTFEGDVALAAGSEFFGTLDPIQLTDPRHILLTGATGFVGIHLLEQLLATSAACVHCLVRCENSNAGLARIQQISERYQVPIGEGDWSRIRVYPCDLPEEDLGLDPQSYGLLCEIVDLVYHSASAVNFIMPYSYMKRTNVEGARQIIRFCAAKKTKPLMLMSTISVYSWGHRFTGKRRVHEADDIDENLAAVRGDLGYVQSKWVVEKIADLAASQGLPLMTFRLAYATCHSRTGVCAHYQWWGRFIQTCLAYNAVPDLEDMREGLTTVDFMVEAIAVISRKPQALGKKFNLCQADRTNLGLKAFCERVGRHYGRDLPVIPYKDWVALWDTNPEALLYPLLGLFKDDMHEGLSILELYQHNYTWDRSHVEAFLEGSGVRESAFEGEVLAAYLEHLQP